MFGHRYLTILLMLTYQLSVKASGDTPINSRYPLRSNQKLITKQLNHTMANETQITTTQLKGKKRKIDKYKLNPEEGDTPINSRYPLRSIQKLITKQLNHTIAKIIEKLNSQHRQEREDRDLLEVANAVILNPKIEEFSYHKELIEPTVRKYNFAEDQTVPPAIFAVEKLNKKFVTEAELTLLYEEFIGELSSLLSKDVTPEDVKALIESHIDIENIVATMRRKFRQKFVENIGWLGQLENLYFRYSVEKTNLKRKRKVMKAIEFYNPMFIDLHHRLKNNTETEDDMNTLYDINMNIVTSLLTREKAYSLDYLKNRTDKWALYAQACGVLHSYLDSLCWN